MSPKRTAPSRIIQDVIDELGCHSAEVLHRSPADKRHWNKGGEGAVGVYRSESGDMVTLVGLGRLFGVGPTRTQIVFSASLTEKVDTALKRAKAKDKER